jgi:hypothetical protein
MTQVRSSIRGQIRSPVRGQMTLAKGSGESFQDGISFNARTGRVVLKAVGAAPTLTTLTSAFTFTGGNQSMYMGPAGLLVPSVTNTPRIEYDANGNCLGLLMEASRTNLGLRSQEFNTDGAGAPWLNTRNTVTANATTAPDGTSTADKIVSDATAASTHFLQQNISVTSGTTYTFSLYVKAAEKSWAYIEYGAGGFTSATGAYFNLSTGAVGTLANSPTTQVTQLSNGWWRISIAKAATASVTVATRIYIGDGDNDVSFDGDSTSGIHVWGYQVEAGAFPSSYIPTTTVSVARTADSCIRTLGSEFSASAGTVVLAGRTSGGQDAGAGQTIIEFDDATSNERHTITRAATSDTVRYNIFDGGVLQSSVESAALGNREAFKSAWAWALNDIAQSTNGGTVNTDTGATLPTVTQLVLGGPGGNGNSFMNGHILRFDYYPTRLANNMLQQMSA